MLFFRFNKKEKYDGKIGYYGLSDWWSTCFCEEERRYIEEKYCPIFTRTSMNLTQGKDQHLSEPKVHFLYDLAGWFNTSMDRDIGYKIITKAEESIDEKTTILDLHFFYQSKAKIFYQDRYRSSYYFESAMHSCLNQINLSPRSFTVLKEHSDNELIPTHYGFKQLAVIYEQQWALDRVIELCETAKLHGWAGDWNERIDRCKTRLEAVS
ncbi:hypothetical protein BIT28_10260 [Photobacterium proteolyticum]|uniref:Uncharacterized protein n=1 Tax=Photobacterium proteolyticum TaxID=1903952 RepID=A0A1Q9G6L1_9GAMM|nr:hypothetical protein [Photobacterium proteolyticum]OLQ69926.1 hypothetical protein BIT28_10260 [Photobacterium proteolyticum]